MLKHKATVILMILAVMAIALTTSAKFKNQVADGSGASSHQTDTEKEKKRLDFEAQFPVVNYDALDPELNDPEKHARRKTKNSRYDNYS